jgi:hypothetical protein
MTMEHLRSEELVAMDAEALAKRALASPDYYLNKHVELLGSRKEFKTYRRVLKQHGIAIKWKQGGAGSGFPEILLRKAA